MGPVEEMEERIELLGWACEEADENLFFISKLFKAEHSG